MVKSPFKSAFIAERPMHQLVFQFLEMHEKVALIDGTTDRRYTYNEVLQVVQRVASGLVRLGVSKGDTLAILSPNSPEYVFVLYGAMANGVIVTTLNPAYTAYEVAHHLRDSQASWLYTAAEVAETALRGAADLPRVKGVICHGEVAHTLPFSRLLADDGSCYRDDVEISPRDDVAVVPYSSGTTGLPKGVMLTHYNLVATMAILAQKEVLGNSYRNNSSMVMLAMMPFFHAYGLISILMGALIAGATLVILPRFQPEQFLRTIAKYKVTTLPIVPPILIFLAKSPLVKNYDLSSVINVSCGAAPLAADTSAEFKEKVWKGDLTHGYGLTEMTLSVTVVPANTPLKPGSCGALLPNTEAQVVHPETGEVLGPLARGEMWVRGPQMMKGYWNNPQATRDTVDANGWLHTGDIGYYDDDGFFFIVDRLKELIKYKGFQVAPAELEALLLNHPDVADVGVIGVPDARAGEVPKAFIVRKPQAASLTEEDVKRYVEGRLAKFKHLRGGVEFVAEIPKSVSGKILRKNLREMDRNRSNL